MLKILVTGSSGYIGSHLCQRLRDRYQVYALDLKLPQTTGLADYYHVDIRNSFRLTTHFDCVIHLAALVNVADSQQQPVNYYQTNVVGTMNVLAGVTTRNIIFASTGAVAAADSVYAVSKQAAEHIVAAADCDYTIFRIANVLGTAGFAATNTQGLWHKLCHANGTFTINGSDYDTVDGTCVRDFVHVEDVCQAIARAVERPANGTECLGSGSGYSVRQVVEAFQQVNNISLRVRYGSRLAGDTAHSVAPTVSSYYKSTHTLAEMLNRTSKNHENTPVN